MDVASFLFSGNGIGKKSCRFNTISFWREKACPIAKNKNIDEVKAMSYSCSVRQPGTNMALVGFQPSPSRYNFLPAKAIPKAVETAQQLLSHTGANDSQFSKAAFFQAPHVKQLMSFLETDQGIISFREKTKTEKQKHSFGTLLFPFKVTRESKEVWPFL